MKANPATENPPKDLAEKFERADEITRGLIAQGTPRADAEEKAWAMIDEEQAIEDEITATAEYLYGPLTIQEKEEGK